jgi:hypothetical protein
MEPEGAFQELATGPDKSIPHPHTRMFFHFNIILPSTPRSSNLLGVLAEVLY